VCWSERLLPRKLTGLLDCQGSCRDDRQGSRRRKAKGQRQEIAAAAEDRRVGRPSRSTDVHSMHRVLGGRPAGRPKDPDCKEPNSLLVWVDRRVDRKRRSVDRAGRPTVGFGRKSAAPQIWVFKPNDVFSRVNAKGS